MRRTVVSAPNRACTWVDAVAYRPAVVGLTSALPRWWCCQLAELSMRLDDRWGGTGFWDGDAAPAAPGGPCEACGRRAAIFVVGGHDERDDEPPGADDYLGHHPLRLCGWCRVDGPWPIEDAGARERALARARARSVGWRRS